jgi:hypothetical protein
MARPARIVVLGHPHHVTQRGNRRQPTFFEPSGYALYRDLLAEQCRKAAVEVWGYCLMPNLARLVLTPNDAGALARALARPTAAIPASSTPRGALDRTSVPGPRRRGRLGADRRGWNGEGHLRAIRNDDPPIRDFGDKHDVPVGQEIIFVVVEVERWPYSTAEQFMVEDVALCQPFAG